MVLVVAAEAGADPVRVFQWNNKKINEMSNLIDSWLLRFV